jgi:RNA recognition motif-containing protein
MQSLKTGVGAGIGPGFPGAPGGPLAGPGPGFGDASSWLAGNAGPMGGAPNMQMNRPSGQGCSIYIKGMPEDADKLWLYEKFSRFGGILSVRVLLDEHSGRCNGIGFVNYTDPEGARAAHETMNGVSMGERLLHVMVQSHGAGRNSGSGGRLSNNSLNGGNGGNGGGSGGMTGSGGYIPGGVSTLHQQQQQQPDYLNQQGNW